YHGPSLPLPSFPTRRSSDLQIVVGVSWQLAHVLPLKGSHLAVLVVQILFGFVQLSRKELCCALRHLGTSFEIFCQQHGSEFRTRSEEHTSELQSRENLVCRL